jgi:hypothetical protein
VLCTLSLAGIIGAAAPVLSPSPSSRLRNGGAALCPLSFATCYRLRRCVARLLVMFDCRVMGYRQRYGALPPLVLSPLPLEAERSSLTPPRPSASPQIPSTGVSLAVGLPRTRKRSPVFGDPCPVLAVGGIASTSCLNRCLFILSYGSSVGRWGWYQQSLGSAPPVSFSR